MRVFCNSINGGGARFALILCPRVLGYQPVRKQATPQELWPVSRTSSIPPPSRQPLPSPSKGSARFNPVDISLLAHSKTVVQIARSDRGVCDSIRLQSMCCRRIPLLKEQKNPLSFLYSIRPEPYLQLCCTDGYACSPVCNMDRKRCCRQLVFTYR
ncbi:hypothetical protein LZ31DRAFT_10942 [Colletotrichum somersetense]|nr:hypothetical protein LZ31DRAFT_10942 [Colletotrichum somersetense]